ncbi:MAG: hypothetical protein ACI8WB_005506, partial [Phenylobacterium sp.]
PSQRLAAGNFKLAGINVKDVVFGSFIQAVSSLSASSAVYFEMFINGRGNLAHGADASKTIGFLSEYVPVVIEVSEQQDTVAQLLFHKKQLDQILSFGVAFNAMKHMSEDAATKQAFGRFAPPEFNLNFMPSALYDNAGDAGDATPGEGESPIPWHLLSIAPESPGRKDAPGVTDIIHASYITISEVAGCYRIEFFFRDNVFAPKTVERLMDSWMQQIIRIVDDQRIIEVKNE